MKATTVLKNLMNEKNITQAEMAALLDMKSQSGVSLVLSREDVKVSVLNRFLEKLECELIIRDRKTKQEYNLSDNE